MLPCASRRPSHHVVGASLAPWPPGSPSAVERVASGVSAPGRGQAPQCDRGPAVGPPPLTNYRDSETGGLKLAFRGRRRLFGTDFFVLDPGQGDTSVFTGVEKANTAKFRYTAFLQVRPYGVFRNSRPAG
jgi:hypothetical protein